MSHAGNFLLLLKRLGIALLAFTVCRILFFLFNYSAFPEWALTDFFVGIYFDAATIAMLFSPFILLSLLPVPFRLNKNYLRFRNFSFHLSNLVCIILNCIDVKFFEFTTKRSTVDLFKILGFGSDAGNVLPSIIKDYWWVVLMALLVFLMCVWLYKKTTREPEKTPKAGIESIVFVLSIGLFVVVARGGFGLKPIYVLTASKYTRPANIPLVLNTPFTLLKTLNQPGLPEMSFFSEEEAAKIYSPIQQASGKMHHEKQNVVVLIMESYSTYYLKSYSNRERSCAPFLDSLMQHSLWFTHAYSNGKRSIEAMPSFTASIPTFMPEPYITSLYNGNKISSLASILRKHGYHSAFYHGASNGSMGFDVFSEIAEFDEYHGRTEFNDDRHFNGNWGIHDEEFFQYFAKTLNEDPKPVIGLLHSISSHHPFNFPDRYASVFNKSEIPMENAVEYADFALRKFFETVKKYEWYKNTLFIITADHSFESSDPYYAGVEGRYRIPLIFFHPSDSAIKGKSDRIVQQIDIMPSILDYLGYPEKFFAFGRSVFGDQEGIAFNVVNDIYQLITKDYLLQYAGEELIGVYKLPSDSLTQNNLIGKNAVPEREFNLLKAILQSYNNSLSRNKMTVNE